MQVRCVTRPDAAPIATAEELGSGGEARIFAVADDTSLAAKIYRRPTADRESKLRAMIANPPVDSLVAKGHVSIAWPLDILHSADDACGFVGFLMPRVADIRPIISFYNPMARRTGCPLFSYRYLHRTGRNLAAAVHALHMGGYVVGDVNESNILATETTLVTLVDTDSFQVRDDANGTVYRCPVGRPEYTAPEAQGELFSNTDRLPQHDRFALAVLLFQLLMEGTHPFAGVYLGAGEPPDYRERIEQGQFPYGAGTSAYSPLPAAPDIGILSPVLRRMFVDCFGAGHTYPDARPHARAWVTALEDAEHALLTCGVNEQHQFGNHLTQCPWCRRAVLLGGRDPYPSRDAVERGEHLVRVRTPSEATPAQQALPAATTPPTSSKKPPAFPLSAPSIGGETDTAGRTKRRAKAPNARPASPPPAVTITRGTRDPLQAPARLARLLRVFIALVAVALVVGATAFMVARARRDAESRTLELAKAGRQRAEAEREAQAAKANVESIVAAIERYRGRRLTEGEAGAARTALQDVSKTALHHCERSLALDPRNLVALTQRVRVMRLSDDPAGASGAMQEALRLYPRDSELLKLAEQINAAGQ